MHNFTTMQVYSCVEINGNGDLTNKFQLNKRNIILIVPEITEY